MKKSIFGITAAALSLATATTFAQNNLSLQSAMEMALKNRQEIKIQQVNAAVSDNEVRKVNSRFLPQLTGAVDVRYNGELPTQIIPGEVFGAPNAAPKKAQFGTTYATTGGLDLTVPLFNPADHGDKRVAEVQAAYDRMGIQKAEIDVKVEVAQSYFNQLITAEKLRLAHANLETTLSIYTMSKDQEAKGIITQYDLEKTRVTYENAQSDYRRSQNSYQLTLTDLAYRLGIDSMTNFVLTDSLPILYAAFKNIPDTNQVDNRVEIRQQKLQAQIYEANIAKEKDSYWPTISAYGNLTAQDLHNTYALFDAANWYPYNYIGLKASIPIFDGFSKHRIKHGYELQLQSAQLTLEKLTRDYSYDVQQTRTSLVNDQKDLDNQRNNLDNALQLHRIDTDRLRQGSIKPTDLLTTYYALLQAQNNYLNSIYTYLLDYIQYQKAAGTMSSF